VASYCQRHSIFSPNDRIVVAVSAGADSTALLYILLSLAKQWNLTLGLAHLNHRLRGKESDGDEQFVRNLAKKHNLPLFTESADISKLAEERGEGIEEAGRFARYRFYAHIKEEFLAQKVALGHTASDLVETFLARLMRGSGAGLPAMAPVRADGIVRPLLGVRKDELDAYLEEREIPYRQDASNVDPTYERNRIRHKLLPLMRQEFNPRIEEAILRTIKLLSTDESYLCQKATEILNSLAGTASLQDNKTELFLETEKLQKLPPAILSRIIRLIPVSLSDDHHPPSYERLQGLLEMVYQRRNGLWWLTGSINAQVSSGKLRIFNPARLEGKKADGDLCLSEILNSAENGEPISTTALIQMMIVPQEEYSPLQIEGASHTMLIDADKVKGTPTARSPRPGDRFRPLGLKGSKLLSDLFIDQKIPLWERKRAVVIEDEEGIVGVVGIRIDQRVAPDKNTRRYMLINLWE